MLGLIRSGNRCPATRASQSQRLISATPRLHIPATATKPNRQLPIHSPADPILLVTPAQIPLHAAQPASRPITTRRADRQRKAVPVRWPTRSAGAPATQVGRGCHREGRCLSVRLRQRRLSVKHRRQHPPKAAVMGGARRAGAIKRAGDARILRSL